MQQDWTDPEVASQWDAQGLKSNPVRSEQLSMLIRLLVDLSPDSSQILDVGFGSGQIEARLFAARPDWHVIGIDYSDAMMDIARQRLQAYTQRLTVIRADLNDLAALSLPGPCQAAIAVQSLHHLTGERMRAAYEWIHQQLDPGGWFFLMDRMRISAEALWPAYQSIWRRLDDVHGSSVSMHEGQSLSEHDAALARRGDRPATVAEHLDWLTETGFRADVIHAHAHRTLIAARRGT